MGHDTKDVRVFGLNMLQQVLLGIVAGIVVGYIFKEQAEPLKVLGTIFIKLIKMVVAPLILFALISGITSLTSTHHFKGMALKGTVGYLTTATIAVCFGLLLGAIFKPGVGVPLPPTDAGADIAVKAAPPHIMDFLFGLIPTNIVEAMANDMYLQIVVFAIFTGIVMNNISGNTAKVKDLCKEMAHIVFKMIEWIVRLAPLAVFGFIAAMVGTTGLEVIVSLVRLVAIVIGACFIQYLVFGVMIKLVTGLSPMPFYRKMVTTQVMAFSTSSSKATLSTAMRELQDKLGVSQSASNFLMPLGACINMDGTAIYLGLCATFFAQMYGIELHGMDYLMLVVTCTLGSMGAAGVPSGSIIFMGMVLTSVGIPLEGIAVILGVDRILDMFRTTVNITGDATITLIVDHLEEGLDVKTYNE